ncbi:MAG: hypothetical protein QXI71_02050 [Candidatus Bathyarchaeia archaeon]
MWKVELKDGQEVTLRPPTAEDGDALFQMFSFMSDKALEWSMAPYTIDIIQRWIDNIKNLIALVANWDNRIVGYAAIHKFPHPRRR